MNTKQMLRASIDELMAEADIIEHQLSLIYSNIRHKVQQLNVLVEEEMSIDNNRQGAGVEHE